MNISIQANPPVKAPHAEVEDRDLAVRLARGDARALEQLIERYQRRVAGLAARLLAWADGAEDVTQSVFLAAWRRRAQFRHEARLWTYLATITVNTCRSLQRRRWLEQSVRKWIAPLKRQADGPSYQQLMVNEKSELVRAAVARLPQTYREAVVLRYLEGMSIREVASLLGIKRNAVEARLSRARKLLETSLAPMCEE
ncbi:MAG TPA: RNA polymerase sigma factor [Pirellulales bacterium]|jgi:RNA polymerase sigma-70 factor (ECF subfamily)